MLLSLALLAACDGTNEEPTYDPWSEADADTDADSDTDTDADTDANPDGPQSFEGSLNYVLSWSEDPEQDWIACDMNWDLSGRAVVPCEECEFAFDLDMELDEAGSDDQLGCGTWLSGLDWDIAYSPTYYGYAYETLWLREGGGDWTPSFYAEFADGSLSFWASEYEDEPYAYGGTTYYMSSGWSGQASVE